MAEEGYSSKEVESMLELRRRVEDGLTEFLLKPDSRKYYEFLTAARRDLDGLGRGKKFLEKEYADVRERIEKYEARHPEVKDKK